MWRNEKFPQSPLEKFPHQLPLKLIRQWFYEPNYWLTAAIFLQRELFYGEFMGITFQTRIWPAKMGACNVSQLDTFFSVSRTTHPMCMYMEFLLLVNIGYLKMTDDAEGFWLDDTASGSGRELMGSADEEVSCCGVTAALCTHIAQLRLLRQGDADHCNR